jgi:hypothetical protein
LVGLAVLLLCSAPFGISVIGCAKKTAPIEYCNSGDSGPIVGQVASIVLSPGLATTGESLNYGQIGQSLSATAEDCKGNNVSVSHYSYASTSSYGVNTTPGTIFADINPSTGQVCAGTWNRNVGGGIADYTTCTPPTSTPPVNLAAALSTPTTPTFNVTTSVGTPSTAALQLAHASDLISGTLILWLGAGKPYAITVPNDSTLSAVAQLINNATTLDGGITAAYNSGTGTLTISGLTPTTPTPPTTVAQEIAADTLFTTGTQLIDDVVVALASPTASSSSTASITTLTLAQVTDAVSGTLTLAVGTGTPYSIPVAPGTTLAALASQIDTNATFSAEGVSAAYNAGAGTLTISGPVGAGKTLVTTGSSSVPGTLLLDNSVSYLAYVTATASGAVSNAIPVYVHPTVTGVVLGGATPGASNGSCPATTVDPGTDCCPNSTTGTGITAPVYSGTGCLSQNTTGQLVARVYTGGNTLPVNNVTCQVGHLSYATLNSSNVVTIDDTGVATANQPGSSEITATIAQSSTATNAGFFSTCPPASISLSVSATGGTSATVPINNTQALNANVYDTNNVLLTGITLEFNSTEPQTIGGGAGQISPSYPGTAQITAVCQPSSCNPAGFSQIGIYGNGKPITSNPVTITATGQSGTVIYAGSLGTVGSNGMVNAGTGSQYLYTKDFTTNAAGALIKLPYVPNSMVITLGGQSIYMGSDGGLISVTTSTNSVSTANQNIPGEVLSVSPDGSTLVITDPVRQTVSLYTNTGTLETAYGGVGTRASWSPDTQTVYITLLNGQILSHGQFTDWQTVSPAPAETYSDVAVTVPSIGAYFAGPSSADGRSYCSNTTGVTSGNPPTAVNTFLPLADQDTAAIMDRIAATNDGLHMLGAHVPVSGAPTFTDMDVTLPINPFGTAVPPGPGVACPAVVPTNYFKSAAFVKPLTTTGSTPVTIGAQAITGIVPSSNSAVAFVTYNGTSGLLPYYVVPTPGSFGSLQYVTLSSGTAPLSGVFSIDNSTFYVGTAGDDLIHEIVLTYPSSGAPTAVDSGTLAPALPSASGTGFAPANIVLQHPKKATS